MTPTYKQKLRETLVRVRWFGHRVRHADIEYCLNCQAFFHGQRFSLYPIWPHVRTTSSHRDRKGVTKVVRSRLLFGIPDYRKRRPNQYWDLGLWLEADRAPVLHLNSVHPVCRRCNKDSDDLRAKDIEGYLDLKDGAELSGYEAWR